jgi:hypothetical protein
MESLVGRRFGKYTVIGYSHRSEHGRVYWNCCCDCGNEKSCSVDNLKSGHSSHCGCNKKTPRHLIDLTGKRFGRFVVQTRGPDYPNKNSRAPRWWCFCDCGVRKLIRGYHLRQGRILSCGCYLAENTSRRFSKHGLHGTPSESLVRSARARAKKHSLAFDLEVKDIHIPEFCPLLGVRIEQNLGRRGPTPKSPSIDRILPDKGYTKDNVWVISHKANTIKSNATVSELRMIADNLERRLSGNDSNFVSN